MDFVFFFRRYTRRGVAPSSLIDPKRNRRRTALTRRRHNFFFFLLFFFGRAAAAHFPREKSPRRAQKKAEVYFTPKTGLSLSELFFSFPSDVYVEARNLGLAYFVLFFFLFRFRFCSALLRRRNNLSPRAYRARWCECK